MSSRLTISAIAFAVVTVFAQAATAGEVLEEIIEQRYVMEGDATLRISNTDGSIRVYAGDKPEISIQAIKKAYTSERLKGIVVDVNATPTSVAINTTFPPRKNALSDRSGTVDYIVIVPQTTRITQLDLVNGELLVEGLRGGSAKAYLFNGWLAGHNCFGDLELTIGTGRLEIAYDWWESRKFSVKAASTRGSIRAMLPRDASVMLNASTDTGKIAYALDAKKSGPQDIIRSLNTVIGADAEAAIEMKTGDGNIRIDKSY